MDQDDTAGIGLFESIWLQDRVQKAKTIADMGIFPVTTWHLSGRCSLHGGVHLQYETTEANPQNEGWIKCISCWDRGTEKWVPVSNAKKI